MKNIFIYLTFFAFCLSVNLANAQISNDLFKILPDSIKPKNPAKLTDLEIRKILTNCDNDNWKNFPLKKDLYKLLKVLLSRIDFKEATPNNLENIFTYTKFNQQERDSLTLRWRNDDLFYKLTSAYTTLAQKVPRSEIIGEKLIRMYIFEASHIENRSNGIELALRKYNEAIRLVPNIKNYPERLSVVYANMSLHFAQIGLHSKALDFINLAINTYKKANLKNVNLKIRDRFKLYGRIIHNNKTFILFNFYDKTLNKKYLDSAAVLLKTFKIYDKDSATLDSVGTKFFDANFKIRKGDYQSAYKNLYALDTIKLNAKNLINAGKDQKKPLMIYCLIKQGKFDEAKEIGISTHYSSCQFNLLFLSCLSELKKNAVKTGNYKEALHWQNQINSLDRQINALNNRGVVFKIDQKYDIAKKQKIISILQSQKKLQERNTMLIVFISLMIIALIAIIALWLYAKCKSQAILNKYIEQKLVSEERKRKDELMLQKMQFELDKSNQLLAQRKQISVDVHDDVSGNITILKYYIDDLQQQATHEETKHFLNIINEEVASIYEVVRSFMQNLSNGYKSEKFVLVDVLIGFCQKLEEQHNIKIDLNLNEEQAAENLTKEQQYELMRIFKEALTNIIKYAACTKVTLNLSFDKDNCHFEISDNGVGFIQNKVVLGYGIKSIKTRLETLNGLVEFVTAENQGLKIIGQFPLII